MITAFYRNGHLLAVTLAVVLVSGASALFALPRLEDPRITNRNPLVLTPVPGASADRVESLVTEPLEEALQEIEEIKDLESTSRAGISVIAIELRDAVTAGENERVFSKIRDRLGDAQPRLPPDAAAPELDDDRDPAAFTLIVAIKWPAGGGEPRMGMLTRLGGELADRLRNVPGTEIVRLYGGVAEEVRVRLDGRKASLLSMTTAEVSAALREADARVSAGTLRAESRDVQVEVRGRFETLDRIRRVPLRDGRGGATVRVGDLAMVERAWEDPPVEVGWSDGERAVYVAARMRTGEQVDAWGARAKQLVEDTKREAGGNLDVSIVFDQSRYTNDRLRMLAGNLALGATVVVIVIFLSMGLRASMIVGAALPLVVSMALFGILLSGGQLHQMSIFGIIIALGLLIDNAIVVTDEVRKRREAGMGREAALRDTLTDLAAPLFASTLTTALAFAPIVLLPGNAGDFVGYIGGSVILAIVSSYLISMTVIAALAARFGHFVNGGKGRARRRWWRHGLPGAAIARPAERWLQRGLRAPVAAMLVAATPAFIGFALQPHLGSQFFPPVDRDMFDLRVWLPRSTSIEETSRVVTSMEGVIRQDPDVERVHWLAGGSFPRVYYNLLMNRDRSPFFAQGVVDATSPRAVQRMVPELQAELDARFPGAQVVIRSFGQGPPVDANVSFRVYGPSVEELQRLGDAVRLGLQNHPAVLHTRTSLPRGEPKLWLDADEDEARLAGFALRDLARELRGKLDGFTGGAIVEDMVEMPVRVREDGETRATLAGLASIGFPQRAAGFAPLGALGEVTLRPELGGVSRFNAVRCNIIDGYTREGTLPIDVTRDVEAALADAGFDPPPGYRVELGGSLEQDREATASLLQFVPVLGTVMVAALILTFRSAGLAVILGAVGGLSVGLGLLSTFSIGFPISFNTILGTLGLIGVAFNDSIVVIASIRGDESAKRGDPAAIAKAVMACSRHIVSTTLTTIGGFLPLLLLTGGEFWPSLAIVLAGGVAGATLLAMVFVPAAYRLLQIAARHARPSAATA